MCIRDRCLGRRLQAGIEKHALEYFIDCVGSLDGHEEVTISHAHNIIVRDNLTKITFDIMCWGSTDYEDFSRYVNRHSAEEDFKLFKTVINRLESLYISEKMSQI